MTETFVKNLYRNFRVYAISVCLLGIGFSTIVANAEPFDFEPITGEHIKMYEEIENERNKEAFDRINAGEAKEGDAEKAINYLIENLARIKAKQKQEYLN